MILNYDLADTHWGWFVVMHLFGLRPFISFMQSDFSLHVSLFFCVIYFSFSSVSFIGLRLGASHLVFFTADLRSVIGPKVDFWPRFDKFYTRNMTQRILHAWADCLLPVVFDTVLQHNRWLA